MALDYCFYVLSLPLFFPSSSSPLALSLFSVVFLSNSSLQLHFLSHCHLWLGLPVRVVDSIHPIHSNPPAWNGCWVIFQRRVFISFWWGEVVAGQIMETELSFLGISGGHKSIPMGTISLLPSSFLFINHLSVFLYTHLFHLLFATLVGSLFFPLWA